jgi:uncharacterized protein YndB with AHSA1/START domain
MGHIEASRELSADPDALWATVTDLANWDKWFTVHEKWLEDPPDTLTEGAKLTAKIVMLGMANKIEWTIEEVDARARWCSREPAWPASRPSSPSPSTQPTRVPNSRFSATSRAR